MKLEYHTCDYDYLDFYEFNALKTPEGKKSMMIQKLAVPVILLLVLLCTLVFSVSAVFIIIQIVLYAVFSFFWMRYQDKMVRRTGESLLAKIRKKGDIPYSPQGILRFKEDEITDERGLETLTYHYSDIAAVYENNGALYIYMKQGRRLILIAKSVLAENDAREKVLSILKQKAAAEIILSAPAS